MECSNLIKILFQSFVIIFVIIITHCSCRKDCPKFCNELYKPLCGSNGVTYGNKCRIQRAACHHQDQNILEAYPGECKSPLPEISSKTLTERTFLMSFFTSFATWFEQGILYTDFPDCPPFCNEFYMPICGDNGVTYGNECRLNRAACLFPSFNIRKAYLGECIS